MPDLTRLYEGSPVLVQHAMATAFGVRERALRHGGHFAQYKSELDWGQWASADELRATQDRRLAAMVAYCAREVPHYRDLFPRLGLVPADIRSAADLAALPVLDKDEVRAHPDRFTPARRPERLIGSATGGTTGTPLRYLVTPSAVQYNAAIYDVRFRRWAGVAFGQRTATVNGRVIVPMAQQGPPFWRHNLAFNQLYLSAYHLHPDHLPAYATRLRRFHPEVVVGYPSTVHVIARHLLDSGQAGTVHPRAVLLSSETLVPGVRADIEAAFGCPAFDGYSLGELVAFASQCPAGSMHVSPEYGVVELVGGDTGVTVGGGAGGGEIVATGLFNQGMPLLRYRTGDLVDPGDGSPCPCGRHLPVLGTILGRVDDRVVTPEGLQIGPAALSLAFQSTPRLRQAQVRQDTQAEVTVLLATTAEFGPDDEKLLHHELTRRLGPTLAIRFERVAEVPRTAAGKQRLIVSSLPGRPGP